MQTDKLSQTISTGKYPRSSKCKETTRRSCLPTVHEDPSRRAGMGTPATHHPLTSRRASTATGYEAAVVRRADNNCVSLTAGWMRLRNTARPPHYHMLPHANTNNHTPTHALSQTTTTPTPQTMTIIRHYTMHTTTMHHQPHIS